ncbi:MerR family transcriptional regulator [Breznakia pachnodae]|uniref:DNA-binding transcriptional MerR regulator n=1 Tax=Breznakia pachnodae TaxID=265178 RepID=A0ABU0E024_9FIRM|nr:MerR family transcriptional regulator [Breznakia pachnodae]MDQ0360109.1 DNA-binding transcriptional MerR regulator [Breznakia pachnodae]
MYKIGEFSKLVNVSKRMLRHYDECGIFSPAYTDENSGYRMYSVHQIPHLNQIIMLRDSGFKIEEINSALEHAKDTSFLISVLESKKKQSYTTIKNEQKKIKKLEEQMKLLKEEKRVIKGTEIDFVVKNSLKALELYKKIFEIEVIEATDYPEGKNEAVFTLYGTRFHMLDANPEYGLMAPDPEHPNTIWFNISVEDIKKTHETALANNCMEIQPVTEMMDGAISNSLFVDPFGYMWMLHQIYQVLSFEERIKIIEEEMES